MVYDLIVVGNGLAAQVFLHELFTNVKNSQTFSVAQIFSEEISPACSLRSTASVSLSGIEEGVSELGDELRKSYFHFENFYQLFRPSGVEGVEQLITAFSLEEKQKLQRRYKDLSEQSHILFKEPLYGKKLQSYIISPQLLFNWFEEQLAQAKFFRRKNFVHSVSKNSEGLIECHLLGGEQIVGRKILFCTGAYAKIYAHFFEMITPLERTQVVAGSFLEREVDLKCDSFYFTHHGHNLIYRKMDHKLILGSASTKGPFTQTNFKELSFILELFKERLSLSLGEMNEFRILTGLRHKGIKRRALYGPLDEEKKVFLMSGFYKNGYTFAFYTAKEIMKTLFSTNL